MTHLLDIILFFVQLLLLLFLVLFLGIRIGQSIGYQKCLKEKKLFPYDES